MSEVITVRKKPVQVQAMLFDGSPSCAQSVTEWAHPAEVRGVWNDHHLYLDVMTLEGAMRANPGDYVIRGIKGEFYPCKPDIFLATYDIITELKIVRVASISSELHIGVGTDVDCLSCGGGPCRQ